MKNMFKRLLSIAIVAVMVIGMIPSTAFYAFAAEETDSVIDTEAELSAALAAGGEVTLGGNVTVTDTITIPAGVTATLNLNGKTISQEKECSEHYCMIENKGTLTVTGEGKISFTDTSAGDPAFGWGAYTLANYGTLVVENGTIENLSSQNTPGNVVHMYCAIQQGSGTVSTTINGGKISTPTYRSVRTNAGALIINGGEFEGQVWVQPNQGDCTIEVNGGSFAPTAVDGSSIFLTNAGEGKTVTSAAITGGTFATKIGASNPTALAGVITGGTFTEAAVNGTNAALLGENMSFVSTGDGTYGVIVDGAVAKVGETYYVTLAEALAAAAGNGDTITLIANVNLTEGVTVPAGKEITLDLNGKTLSGTDTTTKSYALITNRGTLTIEDSVGGGKITLAATTDTGFDRYSSVISNTVGGKLTVKGGTLEHLGGTSMAYAIDNLTNGKGTYAETVIEGGTVKSTYRAIRQFLNGIEAQNILTVTGGTIEGANKSIWMQDPSAKANTGTLTVGKDATLNGDVYLYVTPGSTTWPVEVSIAAEALSSDSEVLTGNVPEGLAVVNKGGNYGVYEMPTLPTATVSKVENDALTFATNFKADEVTDAQLAYYGDWYADFVLTFPTDVTLNANGGADGYLSGQYDAWSENWVNVPFEDVSLKGGEGLKVMEYAAKLMGKPGLKLTYNDVYTAVKDFDCGVFLEDAYIAENAGKIITLELRMYNPEDESENYVIGETYEFVIPAYVPELPTATVSEVVNEDLTFATNFKADEVTDVQLAYYGDWYADFVLTFPTDVTLNANGGADGYLSGQYDSWSENWVNVPFEDVSLKGGEGLKVMEYAAKLMGKPGLKLTYNDVYTAVKDFDCGVFLEDSYISANAGKKILLELRMYNPENEAESYVIGETYEFIIPDVDAVYKNTTTGKTYDNSSDATMEAKAGETVILLKDHTEENVHVSEDVDLDLNGYTLTATYASVFGNLVDDSEANSGALVVEATKFLIQANNKQLTVKTAKGYQFVEIIGFNQTWMNETTFVFQPLFESAAHDMLNEGVAVTGVSIQVEVTWKPAEDSDDRDTRTFKYGDTLVTDFINSYKPATGKYGRMFTLAFVNPDNYLDLTCNIQVESDTGVICAP